MKITSISLIVISILFFITPIFFVLLMSFNQNEYLIFPPKSFSFRWYIEFFNNKSWLLAILNSLIIASISSIIATFFAVVFSFKLQKLYKYRIVLFGLYLMPIIVPVVILATGLLIFLSKLSLVDTFFGIILAHSLIGIPYALIPIYSGINKVDSRLEQTARNLGASYIKTIQLIYLPIIKKSIYLGYTFAFLGSLNEVVIILFLTGNKIITLPFKIWEGFRYEINPVISVAAVILLLISLVMLILIFNFRKVRKNENE